MKIDITALEQMWLEAKKTEEENFQEKSKMNVLIEVLEVQLQNAQEIIEALDNENKELRGKLITFVQKGLQYLEMEANLSNVSMLIVVISSIVVNFLGAQGDT